jgi:predicted negative regulator of RcsB-dependent stress response
MATYDLQEQESLAELKSWWKQNGGLVLTVVAIALLVMAAWNLWTFYQRNQAAGAAVLYEQLQSAARANDAKATREAAGALLEKYPRTEYAPLAALVSAKASYAANDLKSAQAQLQWAVDHARSDAVKAVARLRLASVLLDQNALDQALHTLDGAPPKGFGALYQSMRGDILAAQKKIPEARAAW